MRLGKPEENTLADHLKFSVDDIDIYCRADLAEMAGGAALKVDVVRTIFRKKLVLYGIRMENH